MRACGCELGWTKWLEVAGFKGFESNGLIFGAEIGLIQRAVSALNRICELVGAQSYRSTTISRSRLLDGALRLCTQSTSLVRPRFSFCAIDFESFRELKKNVALCARETRI